MRLGYLSSHDTLEAMTIVFERVNLGRLIRNQRPSRRKGSRAFQEEKGARGSQGGEKDKFFFSTFFPLSHIKCFFFKPRANGSRVCFPSNSVLKTI